MRIQDLSNIYYIENVSDLAAALSKRYEGRYNSFWIYRDAASEFPFISLLVDGSLAYLHYFPSECNAGFSSIGSAGLPEGETNFRLDSIRQVQPIQNSQVVNVSSAVAAVEEFYYSPDLPQAIEWMEM